MSLKQMTKVWEWSDSEGTSLLVMLALADHADDDGYCFPGIARIARKCRVSERSVQRHLRDLEKIGELVIEEGRGIVTQGGCTNRYRITVTPRTTADNPGHPRTQSGDRLTGGDNPGTKGVTNGAKRGDTALPPEPSGESEFELSGDTPVVPKGTGEASLRKSKTDGFESFWRDYPRKVSKEKARNAWVRHNCASKQEEIALSLAEHKLCAQWLKQDGRFIPHPQSWINAHGWENDVTPAAPKQPTGRHVF